MYFFFFYLGLLFWLLTLVAWLLQHYITGVMAFLSIGAFMLHIFAKRKTLQMFGNNKTKRTGIAHPPIAGTELSEGSVIAQGLILEGNITTTGQLYIYGQVKGNIDATEGLVTVMREGRVTGNITAPVLSVDGVVEGECSAERVEICEHGRIEGTLRYVTLSVAQGGVLTGKTERREDKKAGNVIDFSHDDETCQTTA